MSDVLEAEEVPFDAGDAAHVGKRAKDAKRREKERIAVTATLMGHVPGRSWVWAMLSACGVFRTSYDDVAVRMARNEGERNVGLRLLAEIHRVSPEQYLQMVKENSV
jgi:hypothetical protein